MKSLNGYYCSLKKLLYCCYKLIHIRGIKWVMCITDKCLPVQYIFGKVFVTYYTDSLTGNQQVEDESWICCCRCQVEIHDTPADVFLGFLEYLYSDHAPIEDGDSVGLLQLADIYYVPRLVSLCELYITKEVDRSVSKNIEKSDIDVIGLLLISQVCSIHLVIMIYVLCWNSENYLWQITVLCVRILSDKS